jgi:RHS repeat-associated protein
LGTGWGISDLQQLHPQSGGILLTTGNGRARFFSGGPDTFTSPPRDFTTLVTNPDGTYTRTFKDGTRFNFNAQGYQTSVVDRNGNTTNFTYDGNNRLTTITDPVGLVTTLTYGPNGKLQTISDPASRQTQFQHDSAGNLTRITNPDGTFVTYAYDGGGRLTQATNERGHSTTYSYDYAGRFSQSVRPGSETRSLFASKLQGLPNTGAGFGTPTNPAPIVRAQDAKAIFTDGRGNSTEYTLNTLGQVTSQKDALGQVTATQYDASGNPTRITRPNGAITTMTYDAKGNLLTSTDPIGATTTFTYESTFNQVKTIRDPKGNTTTINYDVKGNPIEIIDALNNRTQMTYDSRGLLLSVTSAVGTSVQTVTSFTYDARGNLFTTTNPKADVTTLAYDNAGNVNTSTDAENRVTQFTYDARNRLIAVLDADLKSTQYGYDPKGNLTQVRDAKNQITTFAYDAIDRLTSATNPLNLTETFIYDGNGNLTSSTNRNSQTITFNYDALNRLTTKTRPPTSVETGAFVTAYTYDLVGNLTSVSNPVTNVINQYDVANRLVSSVSTTEQAAAGSVVQINSDTLIDANNRQFEGRTIQVNGRTLTVDGSHTFTNLILLNGAVLTHSPTTGTTLNKLDITVTGLLQIDPTSRIDVSGRGYLGGRQPGNPFAGTGSEAGFYRGMTVGFQSGSTLRGGGSHGGLAGIFNVSEGTVNPVYGNFRDPIEPGSGGAAASGTGGSGGGLARIVAQTLVLDGAIKADGGNGIFDGSGGSGGALRIDVGAFSGAGQVTATGGNGVFGGGGGGGRITIYYQSMSGFDPNRVSAFGGFGAIGGAGTAYLQGPTRENGELVVDNGDRVPNVFSTRMAIPSSVTIALTHLRVRRAGKLGFDHTLNVSGTLEVSTNAELVVTSKPIVAGAVVLNSNSVLTHFPATGSEAFKIDLNTTTLTIDSASRIDVTGRGFLGGAQPGNPFGVDAMTQGFQRGSTGRTGGSYGGVGGAAEEGTPAAAYGDFRNPNEQGGGGSTLPSAGLGGNGGGLVRIVAQSIQLNGSILANGANGFFDGSGGSGGGVRLDVGTLTGTGQITAIGGNGIFGGGGAGGRIAVYYQSIAGFTPSSLATSGGQQGNGRRDGGAGTRYLQGPARELGELVIDNGNLNPVDDSTPIFTVPAGPINLTDLRIRRGTKAKVDTLLSVENLIDVSSDSRLVAANRVLATTVRALTRATLEAGLDITGQSIEITDLSVVSQLPTTATMIKKLAINAGSLTVSANSKIDVSAKGFLGGKRPGNPFGSDGMTSGLQRGSTGRTGGSHGGLGGTADVGTPAPVYDDNTNPLEPGGGGATAPDAPFPAGTGGGLVRIIAQSLVLDGTIVATGGTAQDGGGGAGGGVRVDVGTLSGAGQITAAGGNGTFGAGGGGGRVAVYYQTLNGFSLSGITALGGQQSGGRGNGQNGTVFTQQQTFLGSISSEGAEAVMKAEAEIESSVIEPVRVAQAAVPQRRIFDPTALIRQTRDARPQTREENLYLAMAAEGKLKPFATIAMLSQGSSASDSESSTRNPQPETRNGFESDNPKSKIENPKLDDLDPIYTYDLNGNRTSMIDPTGLTTYAYDALNRLTSITNNKGQVTSFTYDALGRRTSMTHANGVVTSYTYDAASQLLTLGHQLGATTINSFSYTYDKVGNRKTKTSRDGLHDYSYDVLNRLTQATNPLPSNPLESFTYDPVGNRTNSNQNGLSIFNTANQLLEDANFTYQYDNNGNQITKTAKVGGAVTQYEYDAENKLVRVVSPGNTANYRYDGLGRRVEKEVIAGTTTVTRYVYDNEDILLELNGANAIVARYTHGPGIDEPLIMEENSQSFYYHADGLGSITDLTAQSGTVTQRYTYSSVGTVESQLDPNFVQPYMFTSRESDPESGLYYYRERFYDPAIGRFLQEDLLAGPMEQSQFRGKYIYVLNNPIVLVDFSGLGPAGAAIGGTIGATIGGIIGGSVGGVGGAAAGTVALPGGGTIPGAAVGGAVGAVEGSAIGLVTGAIIGCFVEDLLTDLYNFFSRKKPEEEEVRGGHKTRIRPSTEEKHENAEARRRRDQGKTEKGDERRKRYK